jgi:membrane protein implicated in regulation of membrane protease activity
MQWWAWIVLGAALFILEMVLTTDFFLIFFGAAGVLMGLMLLVGVVPEVWAQWLIFATVSIATLIIFRRRVRKAFDPGEVRVDEIVGDVVVATEPVAHGDSGHLEARGTVWRVANVGETDINPGDKCHVTHRDGVVLHVEKTQ